MTSRLVTGDVLPKGSTLCPADGELLWWNSLGGMRLWERTRDGPVYAAQCQKCGKRYNVRAPNKPQGD